MNPCTLLGTGERPEGALQQKDCWVRETDDITTLLGRARDGDADASARLLPLIYQELHRIAEAHMRRERPDHTLQATVLVNEAYMKLVDQSRAEWHSRRHFMAVAATAMRRILVNHAKSRGRLKRGGDRKRVNFDGVATFNAEPLIDLIALDEALDRLADFDERKSRVVECRYFGGMAIDETALLLDISPATVKRDWEMARAWLLRELTMDGGREP